MTPWPRCGPATTPPASTSDARSCAGIDRPRQPAGDLLRRQADRLQGGGPAAGRLAAGARPRSATRGSSWSASEPTARGWRCWCAALGARRRAAAARRSSATAVRSRAASATSSPTCAPSSRGSTGATSATSRPPAACARAWSSPGVWSTASSPGCCRRPQALVVPSMFPEAFGMVAAEAAACGALPVCACSLRARRGGRASSAQGCRRRSGRCSRSSAACVAVEGIADCAQRLAGAGRGDRVAAARAQLATHRAGALRLGEGRRRACSRPRRASSTCSSPFPASPVRRRADAGVSRPFVMRPLLALRPRFPVRSGLDSRRSGRVGAGAGGARRGRERRLTVARLRAPAPTALRSSSATAARCATARTLTADREADRRAGRSAGTARWSLNEWSDDGQGSRTPTARRPSGWRRTPQPDLRGALRADCARGLTAYSPAASKPLAVVRGAPPSRLRLCEPAAGGAQGASAIPARARSVSGAAWRRTWPARGHRDGSDAAGASCVAGRGR